MTKELKWRLSKLPTVDELQRLVNDKIITKEEAKDVLFKDVEDEDEDKIEALEEEIKFLKELVQKLADNDNTVIVKHIGRIRDPYYLDPWYGRYQTWCDNSGSTYATISNSVLTASGASDATITSTADFTSIPSI